MLTVSLTSYHTLHREKFIQCLDAADAMIDEQYKSGKAHEL